MKKFIYLSALALGLVTQSVVIQQRLEATCCPIVCKCSLNDVLKGIRCFCLCLQCVSESSLTIFDKLDRIQTHLPALNKLQKSSIVALINLCFDPNYPCRPSDLITLQELGFVDADGNLNLEDSIKDAILLKFNLQNLQSRNRRAYYQEPLETSFPAATIPEEDITLDETIEPRIIYRTVIENEILNTENRAILKHFLLFMAGDTTPFTTEEYEYLAHLGLMEKTRSYRTCWLTTMYNITTRMSENAEIFTIINELLAKDLNQTE